MSVAHACGGPSGPGGQSRRAPVCRISWCGAAAVQEVTGWRLPSREPSSVITLSPPATPPALNLTLGLETPDALRFRPRREEAKSR